MLPEGLRRQPKARSPASIRQGASQTFFQQIYVFTIARRRGPLCDTLYLTRFQVSVGTNDPCGDEIGARTYVMSSPFMMLTVAFCSVPSKFGFVEPWTL